MLTLLSRYLFATLFVLLIPVSSFASIDVFEFDSEGERLRYQEMIDELRCPKCQNQNLSGSNSPIAQDLRKETYRLINEGATDEEILEFMVARYGEFVRYRPEVNSSTYALWFGPLALLVIALLVAARLVWNKRSANAIEGQTQSTDVSDARESSVEKTPEASALSADEQARLASLLGNQETDSDK